ncbi:hypothetical protein HYDPIDRAFT_87879 [Hydnomerulius pinastri MD-312]|nr:hypothetical protein HYDPIDRAFT_87879 [Hydnomerulius pinastri MD-312]
MAKLHLKRTPAEEEERARRKARKAARRAAKRKLEHAGEGYETSDSAGFAETSSSKKRRRDDPSIPDIDDDVYGPPPPPSSSAHKLDYDAIQAEMEEMRFREKMWGAFEDDERLDAIDSKFNDYAHVPDRWGRGHDKRDEHDMLDPQYMDDDEYAEWVRNGMWRKKHAGEYEEQARKDAAKAARKSREKEIKAETARLEKAALERREHRRWEKTRRREEEYRQSYERRWKELLGPQTEENQPLTFADIPWPLFAAQSLAAHEPCDKILTIEEFTTEAISMFVVPISSNPAPAPSESDENKKRERRDKLKETMLRFHPDKFEGRIMRRVLTKDKDRVREAVGQVARALNTLMSEQP